MPVYLFLFVNVNINYCVASAFGFEGISDLLLSIRAFNVNNSGPLEV